jgi:hypothetical protein
VETRLWKLGFHARIERVRSLSASDKHAAVSLGMPVISLGEEIYNAMVHSLAEETEATGALSSKMLTHYAKGTVCLYIFTFLFDNDFVDFVVMPRRPVSLPHASLETSFRAY